MKTIKKSKTLILAITLALYMLFTSFIPSADVYAASAQTKALTAYQQILKKLDSKSNKFALIYLNNDSVPELLITPSHGGHVGMGEVYTYTNGKTRNLKYAGSDYGHLIYSPKKSITCNSAWINGYGAVETFYKFSKNGSRTKLKTFTEIMNPKISYEINGKKVTKSKFTSEFAKMQKKYPLKQIYPTDTFSLTTQNIRNLVKNYKSFVITGKSL